MAPKEARADLNLIQQKRNKIGDLKFTDLPETWRRFSAHPYKFYVYFDA
jgi:hypothetical protein